MKVKKTQDNPRIKPYFSLVPHSADCVELRYGVWNPVSFTLTDDQKSGRLFELLRALDGSRSLEQLALEEQVSQEQLEDLLGYLRRLDLLETGPSTSLDYYLDNIIPPLKQGRVDDELALPVTVIGDDECGQAVVSYLRQSLPTADIARVSESDPAWRIIREADPTWLTNGLLFSERLGTFEHWRGRLLVFVTRLINPVQCQILNRVALELDIPWIHAAFDGPFLFVGPAFVPHRSACYECFEGRVMLNLRENAGYLRYKEALVRQQRKQGAMPIEGVLCGLLGAHVAMEALNYVLTRSAFTVNKVLAIYLPTMEMTFNEVLRVPGCAGCGSSAMRDQETLYFDTRALIQNNKTIISLRGALDYATEEHRQ
jgi:bacteriocin biosynthesis cyclodehydratase domain-containing protein